MPQRFPAFFFLLLAFGLYGQTNTGELRFTVKDATQRPVQTTVVLVSQANEYQRTFQTDTAGRLSVTRLPYGVYRVTLQHPGFAPYSVLVEIRSALPKELNLVLTLAPIATSVTVTDSQTLIDPNQVGTVNRIGSETIADRPASLPGRSIVDLVNSQPGWLYEGNAVLHPRGSEYNTQFVIDGIPLTDNRSPSFGPEIEADDVQSLSIYTAGFPAEYGRKLGGVVAVEPAKDTLPGFHGEFVGIRRQLLHRRRLFPRPVCLGAQHTDLQPGWIGNRSLSEPSGAAELHQSWKHGQFLASLRTRSDR